MTKQNYIALTKQGIKCLETFNKTTRTKKDHYALLENLRKIFDNTLTQINYNLFESSFNYAFLDYQDSIKHNNTKKELDKRLNYCLITTINTLKKIVQEADCNLYTWLEN